MTTIETPAPSAAKAPRSKLTMRVRRDLALDRAAFQLATRMAAAPTDEEIAGYHHEVDAALEAFDANGWTADPLSFHREPTTPARFRRKRVRGIAGTHEYVTWADDFEPHADLPGRERWIGKTGNNVVRVPVLRHGTDQVPWVILVHGWGMGRGAMDRMLFRAKHLHHDLGVNVALVVLPHHGKRKPAGTGLMSGFPGPNPVENLHGFSQAVWDIRQFVTRLREHTDQPIGLMGLSLGGYTTALTASIDDRLHAAITLVPAVDMSAMMADSAERLDPDEGRVIADLTRKAAPIMAPVSPLHLEPKVPHAQRMIVAGTLDQFVPASSQVLALWAHWDQPELRWFHSTHTGLFWAKGVQDKIDAGLRARGLATR